MSGAGAPVETRAWHVVAASVAGSRHVRQGRPCEDRYIAEQLGPALLVAVADGAGSAPFAGEGASTASQAALGALRETLAAGSFVGEETLRLVGEAIRAARAALEAEAATRSAPAADFATTLIVAVALPTFVAAGQVGDGCVIAGLDGRLEQLTAPDKGEYANETAFLTSKDFELNLQLKLTHGTVTALAARTDGLDYALHQPGRTEFLPWYEDVFSFARESGGAREASDQFGDYLASERVRSQTDDDVTVVVGVLAEG